MMKNDDAGNKSRGQLAYQVVIKQLNNQHNYFFLNPPDTLIVGSKKKKQP